MQHEDTLTELRTEHAIPEGAASADWELLLDQDPHATFFQSPRYLRLWHDVLGQRFAMRVHTVHADGRVIGVIADENDRAGGPTGPVELRRFLGGTEVTDYLGPVSRPEDRADVARAYLSNLANDVDWDEFIAGGLVKEAGWGDHIRRAVDELGLVVTHEETEDVCPRVDLSGGFAAYRKRLPGRNRQELARKARKLAREVGGLELVRIPAPEVAGQMDAFLDQAAQSFPDKSSFFEREEIHAWFRALAEEFAADGIVRLHRLDVGGLPAAMTVSIVANGEWGLYNSSFDPALATFAPGMVIVWMLLEEACGDGIEVFDLLRGNEEYKYRFGAQDRVLERIVVGRG